MEMPWTLLTTRRNAQIASSSSNKTLQATHTQNQRVINVACPETIDKFKKGEKLSLNVELRQNKYLNNMKQVSQ